MVAKKFNVDIDLQGNTLKNPAFDAGAIGNSALATNPLDRSNHTGTQAASTISDLATVVKAYRLDEFAVPTANISLNSHKLTNVTDGTATTDAATYGQLISMVNGTRWLQPVICATTANITLSGEQTLDGVATSASRVLVKNQSTASQNGIYLSASGSWARTADLPSGNDAASVSVFVEQGTTLADTQWVCTTNTGSAVVGTDSLTFAQFGSSTSYSADESTLHLSGTTFSVKTGGIGASQLGSVTDGTTLDQSGAGSTLEIKSGGVGTTQLAAAAVTIAKLGTITDGVTLDQSGSGSSLEIKAGGVSATQLASNAVTTAKILDANVTDAKLASTFCKKYSADFGDGAATSFTITHSLGSKDVQVTIRRNSTDAIEEMAVVCTSTTQITITTNSAPASNAFRVVVIG